jgi:hypothetical protein
MFSRWIIVSLLGITPTVAMSAPFDPPISTLCAKSAPLVVNKPMLLKQLLIYEKIFDGDLDQGPGEITFEVRKDAVLHPDDFCKRSQCAKGVADKLGNSVVQLGIFLISHSHPPADTSKGYVLTSNVSSDIDVVQKYLTSDVIGARCVAPLPSTVVPSNGTPNQDFANPSEAGSGGATSLLTRISLRKNVADLIYSTDSAKFKGLDPATFNVTSDLLKHSNAFTIDLALGAPVGPKAFGNGVTGQIIPFVTYDQNYVEGDPTNKSKVFNLGAGITGDMLFPLLGFYQDVQFFPKYVNSFSTGAKIVSGNLVYTPEPDLPLIGQVFYVIPGTLSVQLAPQLIYVYGDVINDGGDPSLLKTGNFQRLGPKIAFAAVGEGLLAGYTYSASYEDLKSWGGPVSAVALFQTSLNYTFANVPSWSAQVQYVNGRNLDTLQQQRQITLGFGLKF